MKKVVLLGPPGAGKGTISELLIKHENLIHISVGDILRRNILEGTDLGILANSYMSKGDLLPNNIIIDLVEDRLSQDDCKECFLLDGYPRTIKQAEALETFSKPNFVFNLDVDTDIIIDRLIGRRMCKKCNSIFHISNLEDSKKCPKCSCELYQRKDDNEDVVRQRIDVYIKETAPLVKFYKDNGSLINIDASKTPQEVFKQIEKYIK